MRLWFSGPRIMGIRAGVSIPVGGTRPTQRAAGQAITGAFVYVVRGDHNLTKIGVTTNPRARLAQLRTGSGFPIDYALIAAAEGDAYAIEQAAHQILDAHRVNGEWFDVSPEMAQAALWGAAAKLNQRMQSVSLADSDKVLQIAAAGPEPKSGVSVYAFLFMQVSVAILFISIEIKMGFEPLWVVLVANALGFGGLVWAALRFCR